MPGTSSFRLFEAPDLDCLETRRSPSGLRRRRYSTQGVRVTTVEVPIEIMSKVGKKLAPALEGWQRAHDRKVLKARAQAMLRSGVKQAVVELELGLHRITVYRYAAELRGKKRKS